MPARILIVEDERITAEDLRDILTDLGYTVTASVSSGADAIAQAGQNPPDLALMDIRIKGDMDGTETARVLRERFNIPVVYLTAHADTNTLSRAKLAQPLGYITKPFQEAELHAAIEIALHKHQEDLKHRGQEELLASTMRAIAEGVIAVDKPELVTLFNPAAEAWTGWNAREVLGKTIREVFPLVDGVTGEALDTPLWRVLSEGTVEDVGHGALLVDRSGAKRPITGSIAPTRDHRGEISGAVLVFGRATNDATGLRRRLPDYSGESVLGMGDFKMVAASPSMKQVLKFARRVAESEVSTILLEGESGTGKDIIAQFIHHFGRRRDGPFVAINCAAIPETLLESELFGYEKGAFTDARAPKAGILEVASGGTIFLDEVGEMPLVLQAKMLRVLEEQTFRRLGGVRDIQVDVRVVAATNRKLTEAIEQGKFRLDLYYRLNVIQVLLPPLRDRKEDILPLAETFVKHYNSKFKRAVEGLSHGAAAVLLEYDWPGNVRELRNVIERAMVLEESDWIQTSSLQVLPARAGAPVAAPLAMATDEKFDVSLEEAEKSLLMKALERAEGNQTRAAVLLGITRDTLRYKIKKFNLR
ncbi:MAG TPA: sigma 54-interacting transcriptional regulator [Bryobacteraceae bacterium]|jgi:two-component system response regulator AtoC|nr:sigma 54-interacting transcriptional regulator [Bryobacteraceae bacterium]